MRKQLINQIFDKREVQKRSLKKQSPVWINFRQVVDQNKNDVVGFFCCNVCLEVIKNDSKTGTTTPFSRHVCRNDKGQQSIIAFTSTSTQKKINISQHHHDELREGTVQFVCADLRPLRAIECQGLLALIQAAVSLGQAYPKLSKEQVRQIIPSRCTVAREVEAKADTAREMIKRKLYEALEICGGFACTTDLWTDKFRQITYLAITGHLNTLTDTQIKHDRYMLCLEEVDEPTKTKEVIDNHILAALSSYGISKNDIETKINFVTDRGSQYRFTDMYKRANCWAHLLNNVVEKMCEEEEAKQAKFGTIYEKSRIELSFRSVAEVSC